MLPCEPPFPPACTPPSGIVKANVTMRTGYGNIFQTSFVVSDLDAAINNWIKSADVGPFFILKDVRPDNVLYRGKPAPLSMDIGLVQSGGMQIELIQQTSEGPSPYRDSVAVGASGFHHVCYLTDDLDRDFDHFRTCNAPVACQANYGTMRYAYFDTRALIDCMTEVIELDDATSDLFKMVADASLDWDKKDPVRYVAW